MAGTVEARAVMRHDDRTRRGNDDRSGSRDDDRSCHDWGWRDDDWCRLRHNNGLRNNWRGLRHDDRSGLGDNGRLRIDNDSRWWLDGFRDVGASIHDVKHRIEAAVVEGSAVMVMWLGLEAVACQHESGDGQTEDGVACVFHGVLLFIGWFVC